MKTPVLLAMTLSAVPFAVAAGVEAGDTAEEVRAALGAPSGEVRRGDRRFLYYPRGSVELRDGRVARVELRSPAEQAVIDAREERQEAELAARRARLAEEGTALRNRKLADADFRASPAAYQVSFWEDFARRYPGVPCAEPLSLARATLAEQLEEKRRRQEEHERLARIEERLAAAESAPRGQTRIVHRGRHHRHEEFALWPVNYTFYDAPLPVYTSPTASPVTSFKGDLAQPERREYRPPAEGHRGRHPRRDECDPGGRSPRRERL